MNYAIFIFIGLIFLILSTAHFVVYKYLISVLNISSPSLLLLAKVLGVILAISFIAASVLASLYNNFITRILYRISAVWLGLLLYLFISALMYALVLYFIPSDTVKILGKALIAFSMVVWAYGLVHAEDIQIKNVSVTIKNLPVSWHGKKAVWVSDVHLGQVHSKEYAQKVVTLIEGEKPDIVFIGGDLFDGVKVDENEIISPFRDLHAPWGVYFITGNHEEFSDNQHFLDAVERAGIRVLNNESVNIDGVNIIGVFDKDSVERNKFNDLLSRITSGNGSKAPYILLKHQPKDIDIAQKDGIDLQISGHTHRAQMFPLSLVPKLVFKGFDYGLHAMGNTQVLTSSGVGTWGPPLRVGTDSEILSLTFR